jgi:hypothetical protein
LSPSFTLQLSWRSIYRLGHAGLRSRMFPVWSRYDRRAVLHSDSRAVPTRNDTALNWEVRIPTGVAPTGVARVIRSELTDTTAAKSTLARFAPVAVVGLLARMFRARGSAVRTKLTRRARVTTSTRIAEGWRFSWRSIMRKTKCGTSCRMTKRAMPAGLQALVAGGPPWQSVEFCRLHFRGFWRLARVGEGKRVRVDRIGQTERSNFPFEGSCGRDSEPSLDHRRAESLQEYSYLGCARQTFRHWVPPFCADRRVFAGEHEGPQEPFSGWGITSGWPRVWAAEQRFEMNAKQPAFASRHQ